MTMTTTEEQTRDAPWIGLRDLNLTRFMSLSAALYCSLALANHPLALVKTRLQHAGTTQQSSLAALRALHRGGGVRSLYVAFVPATLGAMPGEFAYIAAVEAMRDAVAPLTQRAAGIVGDTAAEGGRMFVSGAAANVTSLFLFTPCDVIVQRAWVGYGGAEAGSRHPVRDAVRATYAAQGLRGFWSGYWASLATYAPGCAVWWSVYAMARQGFTQSPALPTWGGEGLAGVAAGVATAVVSHPMDTIKTRLQTGVDGTGATWMSVARTLLRVGGGRALFRGLGARVLELGPISGAGAVGYEAIKQYSARTHTSEDAG